MREVQVMPSGEVMTKEVPFMLTATKRPFPKAMEDHKFATAAARAIQEPSRRGSIQRDQSQVTKG